MSPNDFFKLKIGSTIYYEVINTNNSGCIKAQRYLCGQAEKADIKIKQSKVLSIKPDTIEPILLLKVDLIA